MDITAGLSFVPYARGSAGRRRDYAILPQIPVWVWPLIYVAIGTGVNYLGIQQTAKFDKLLVFIQLGILAIFVLLIVRLMLLDSSQITLSFRPFSIHSGSPRAHRDGDFGGCAELSRL